MSKKLMAGGIGALLVVAILFFQSVEHWTVVDSVLVGLRAQGPAGVWLANFLTSPIVPLVLAIAAIVLVVEGRKEKRESESVGTPQKSSSASVSGSGNSTSSATGGSVTNLIVVPDRPPEAPKPIPLPPRPEPRFNIECSPVYPILVLEQERALTRTLERNYGYSQAALVMDFTNSPHDEFNISYLSEVIATLRILDRGGVTITPLVWLSSSSEEQSFPIGEPRTVLLGCSVTLNSSQWFFPRFLPHTQNGRYQIVDYNFSVPDLLGVEAEIVLTHRGDGKVVKKVPLILERKKGKPPLIFRKEDRLADEPKPEEPKPPAS